MCRPGSRRFARPSPGALAADQAQSLRAHCLVAAAATLRRIIGAGPPPAWRADLERSLEAARGGLSPDALTEAEARGRSMTLADAIAFALQAPPPHAPDTASPRYITPRASISTMRSRRGVARSDGAASAWAATAAFSSVTWAKSRWLASATARITSVNL